MDFPYIIYKALPVVIIWMKLVWEMCTKDYREPNRFW